jgi:uncharacterized damage-inducible protein DinB
MENTLIKKYIHQIQQAYYGDNWLDEDMEKKLRKVNEENAFIKPDGYIHSIAEIVSHLVEWRREQIERLQFGRRAKLMMDSENNWRSNESLKKGGWAYLKEQLDNTQNDLIALLETKDDGFLESKWSGEYDFDYLVVGLVQHDIYHLGQIGLIYKMITFRSVGN